MSTYKRVEAVSEALAVEVMRVRADEAYDTCRPTKDWFTVQPSHKKQASKQESQQIKAATVHISQWHNPLSFPFNWRLSRT